ncbi:Protein of unknown function [Pyronema omphalodes CBS 100304]|uniref:Uncharacterized protein n=1 Tax=Pyronema omphalodes (strain CBS 100304) TaxID=1076935 RepID=U4LPM7_PYROM|nr:Protein of unknown function [Pyronema omphalodes CBS 100304]
MDFLEVGAFYRCTTLMESPYDHLHTN